MHDTQHLKIEAVAVIMTFILYHECERPLERLRNLTGEFLQGSKSFSVPAAVHST